MTARILFKKHPIDKKELMTKESEINYPKAVGESGREYAFNKPFSVDHPGDMLIKLGFIQRCLPKPPAKILDLGCGTGWTSWMLAKMGYSVVGQDISPDMIQMAEENKTRYSAADLEFKVCDYEQLEFEDEFDGALFFDCLHHAQDEHLALKSAFVALKPGGICVAHEPGTGHSENESTIEKVRSYGVTEKDMPPSKIISMAMEIGFTDSTTIPFPEDLLSVIVASHDGKPVPKTEGGYFGKRQYRKQLGRLMADAYGLFTHLDDSGLVILTK